MDEDPDAVPSLWDRWSARSGWLLGAIGLVAWCAMLWFMFGDVL